MTNLKFGTDGIRGVVGENVTASTGYDLGRSLALFLLENIKNPICVIGQDTRKSCNMLKSSVVSGLLSYGIDCVDLGVVSTPALAFLTKKHKANAGIMITASHNLHEYNGYKIFDCNGAKIDMKTSLSIERYSQILSNFKPKKANEVGNLFGKTKGLKSYISHLKRKQKANKFKVCFDCANGTTNLVVSKVFSKGQIVCGSVMESSLVNVNCGATNVRTLQKMVLQNGYDIGFAFDGDGDRIIAISSTGKIVDGDEILCILAGYFKGKGELIKNTVVGTIVTNYGVEKTLENNQIKLIRQQVGDRFIHQEMVKNGYCLGGEQSGHIIIGKETTTGDGVLVAITLLNLMNEQNKSLDELCRQITKFNQVSVNVKIDIGKADYIMQDYNLLKQIEELENEMSCLGRIVVRPSGTENVIRILVEGENEMICQNIARQIESKIKYLNKN